VIKEIEGRESWYMKLRAFDTIRLKFDPLLRMHYNAAKKLIISASYVQDALLPQHHSKCVVIPPPPPAAIEQSVSGVVRAPRNGDVFRVLYVGRITPSKGLAIVIRALAKLHNKNVNLTVYGKGPYALEYQRMAEDLGLTDQIAWKGFVPNRKLVHAYCQADAFVFPSLKEPTGIALTEAMTAGLPILCANVGGPAFLVGEDCGIKIPVISKEQMVSDLAKAMNRLMENPVERTLMGRNAQRRARTEFSWDAVIRKMIRVYNEVATANRERKLNNEL
jgi:glycosyltransferase involved in cell wall biosynthesis